MTKKVMMKRKNKYNFNCGGYALNTFTFYKPYPGEFRDQSFLDADKFVKNMVDEFNGKLRILENENDALPYERVVFFKGGRRDFHFAYKGKNGQYYNKMGWCPDIRRMTKQEVYADDWNDGYYTSKLCILALDMRE